MATFYLLSNIDVVGPSGPQVIPAGTLLSDTDEAYRIAQASGATLWPSFDTVVGVAATRAGKMLLKGRSPVDTALTMIAAAIKSVQPNPTAPAGSIPSWGGNPSSGGTGLVSWLTSVLVTASQVVFGYGGGSYCRSDLTTVATTDGTKTTVITLPAASLLGVATPGLVDLSVLALGTTAAGLSWRGELRGVYKNVGGTITAVSAALVSNVVGDTAPVAAWTAAIDISSTNLVVSVTGAAATSITWAVFTQIHGRNV